MKPLEFLKTLHGQFETLCNNGYLILQAVQELPRIVHRVNDANDQREFNRRYPVVLSATGIFKPGRSENEEPGTLGRHLWMQAGLHLEVHLRPEVSFEQIEVSVEGGAVIYDIKVGNCSQLVGFHEQNAVTRVKCHRPCQVGSQIIVGLHMPPRQP